MYTLFTSLLSEITPWIPLISVLLSGITSLLVCKASAKHEEKKLYTQYNHEKFVAQVDSFSEMMSLVDHYCFAQSSISRADALRSVSKFFAYAPNNLLPILKELDMRICEKNIEEIAALRKKILNSVSENLKA